MGRDLATSDGGALITLAEMRSLLRRRIDDANALKYRFTDADCVDELNRAAEEISNDVERLGLFERPSGTQTISILAGTTAYNLSSDFIRPRYAKRTDNDQILPCDIINEHDAPITGMRNGVFNRWGGYVFYIGYTAAQAQLCLPTDAQESGTVILFYYKSITQLVTATDDASSYTEIPAEHHVLVPLLAAQSLLGADSARAMAYGSVVKEYDRKYEKMVIALEASREPQHVADTWGDGRVTHQR